MINFIKKTLFFAFFAGLCALNPVFCAEKINAGVVYEFYLDIKNQIPSNIKYTTENLPQINNEELNIAYYKDFRPLNMLSLRNTFTNKNNALKIINHMQTPKEYNLSLKENKIAAAAKIEPSYEEYFNSAIKYKNKEKYKDALNAVNKALKENPLSMEGHFLKADILRLNGQFKESVLEYTLAINIDPKCTDAYFNIAKILENADNKKLALEYYRYAYSTKPDDYEIRNIILSYEKEGIN